MNSAGLVCYAVVGLGHIAQVAVLPAFAHARKNSRLVALFSGDAEKRQAVSARYKVRAYPYSAYESLLATGLVHAVYIALPNSLHKDFAVKAAKAGVHVLCEKPLAVTSKDAREMVSAAMKHRVHLMTAYRLHFDRANLTAMKIVRSGKIGQPRLFHSVFSLPVKPGDIRVQGDLGGGSLYDLGIYCINAARYLFGAEPTEAAALSARRPDPRFRNVDEMTGAILRFPGDRLATFTSSLGMVDRGYYEVVGTKGTVRLEPAYEYVSGLSLQVTLNGRVVERHAYPRRDHFAAELLYFSNCILQKKTPEPSGVEGMADVKVIESLYKSAKTGRSISLRGLPADDRPTLRQEIRRPPVKKPPLVKVQSASGDD